MNRLVASALIFCSVLIVTEARAEEDKPLLAISVTADFGADRGQSFGSLFEARDATGRVVAGAGFADVYNTRFRSDRQTVQFFVRPAGDPAKMTVERLPHPDLDSGVYLLDIDQTLFAWSSVRGNSLRRWDAAAKRWLDQPPEGVTRLRSGDGVMRIGRGRLVFANNSVTFDGHTILSPPQRGDFYNFYYAAGRLFFYHTDRDAAAGFTRILACPWTPESREAIDLENATVQSAKYVGETPFAWGQLDGRVLTVSNNGGAYLFDPAESAWRVLREADRSVSYQVYSMMHFHDRLLLAQYPAGEVFEFNGRELKRREGWPPRLPGVSGTSREAQTLGVFGGDLLVGVWPWAELWRYDRDATRWHSLGRAFTHPELTDSRTHPYEAESAKLGLVVNHWGQRVTGMVPLGDSLMISTSSKGTDPWDPKYDFLTEPQRREYGAVLRLRAPGNLATRIDWKDGPTRFDFVVHRNRMTIQQDGKLLASTPLDNVDLTSVVNAKVTLGTGIYGRFSGQIRSADTTR